MQSNSIAHTRRLLLAGFGGLLLLMVAGGADSIFRIHNVNVHAGEMRDAYLRRIQLLEQVRSGVYQSSIILRDYLLAGDAQSASEEAQKWNAIRAKTDRALEQSAASMEPGEAPLYQKLHNELQDYWKLRESTILPVRNSGNPYSSGDLVQRRVALLALIDRIDQINQVVMDSGDTKLSATFESLRFRTFLKTLFVFGVGFTLAAFTVRRTLLMENELQQRYDRRRARASGIAGTIRPPGSRPRGGAPQHLPRTAR